MATISNNEQQTGAESINLEEINAVLTRLSHQIQQAFRQQDFQMAEQLLIKVLNIAPYHPLAWMDLASAALRQKKHQDAYQYSLKAIHFMQDQVDTNVYDGLTEICHELGNTDEQIYYGRLAIETKKQQVKDEPTLPFPKKHPSKFNAKKPQENIISYSLFGNLPRYGETAVLNMQLAKEIYPEWTVRFYVDKTVPESVIQRLSQQGAQIIYVTAEQQQLSGLYWRFFVMDDPTVKRFLIRDADSFLSYRERAAVDQWLNSKHWFHSMHDGYSHTELILAGMWAGCTGIFHNIQKSIEDFIATGRFLNQRVMDQHYLRYCIWPTLQHSVLIHDRYGYDINAVPFPHTSKQTDAEKNPRFHVGANEASSIVHVTLAHAPCDLIRLFIKDKNHQLICFYDLTIHYAATISLQLPISYANKIQTEEWYISTQAHT